MSRPKRKLRTPHPPKRREITRELAQKVCQLVTAGLTLHEAAGASGLGRLEVDQWRERGALTKRGPYADFVKLLAGAEEARRGVLAAKVAKLSNTSLAAARYLIDRADEVSHKRVEGNPLGGRPTKLTESMLGELFALISSGCDRDISCEFVGIDVETMRRWRMEGRQDLSAGKDTIKSRFCVALRRANAIAEVRMWQVIDRGVVTGKKEHIAAGELALKALNTRFWMKYRPNRGMAQRVRIDSPEAPKVEVNVHASPSPAKNLPPAKYAELRRLMLEARGVEVVDSTATVVEPEQRAPEPAEGGA